MRALVAVMTLAFMLAGCLGTEPVLVHPQDEPFAWAHPKMQGTVGIHLRVETVGQHDCEVRALLEGGYGSPSGLLGYVYRGETAVRGETALSVGWSDGVAVHVRSVEPVGAVRSAIMADFFGSAWSLFMKQNVSNAEPLDFYMFGFDVRPSEEHHQFQVECDSGRPVITVELAQHIEPVTSQAGRDGVGLRYTIVPYAGGEVNIRDHYAVDGTGTSVFVGFHVMGAPGLLPPLSEGSAVVSTPVDTTTVPFDGPETLVSFHQAYNAPGAYRIDMERIATDGRTLHGVMAVFGEPITI